ncbi:cell adhesion molecule CEACAM1-like isoform X2 [Pyxicephalus adspersus]|uniref:cell adhesion molecule CEACAM1-like isoform X2 n=1 Tax=Pyxicephalus adspersus TaxID=30357 RepID=UPI003B5BF696
MELSRVAHICILLSVTLVVAPVSGTELTSNTTEWVWEGESVSLDCTTQVENGTFLWKVNGDSLPASDRYYISKNEANTNSTLIISPIFRNDTGSFICEVSNTTVNETSNAVNISVAKPPDSLSIGCSAASLTGGVQLTCSWIGGDPAADIELSFNGTIDKGKNEVNRSVNLDNDVQQPEFICQGNQVGKTSKCNITLERPLSTSHDNNAVTSATEGENIKLTVSLTSQNSLTPEYAWVRLSTDTVNITSDGKYKVESSSSGSTLHISSATGSESGTYECRARNIIGTTTFKFNVEVKSKGSGGLSGGAIAGIVIGVLAGVALIGVGVFFLVKKLK